VAWAPSHPCRNRNCRLYDGNRSDCERCYPRYEHRAAHVARRTTAHSAAQLPRTPAVGVLNRLATAPNRSSRPRQPLKEAPQPFCVKLREDRAILGVRLSLRCISATARHCQDYLVFIFCVKECGEAIGLRSRHGFRASEVCDLEWSAIDFTRAEMHVSRRKGGARATQAETRIAGLAIRIYD